MILYDSNSLTFKPIKENPFKLEREIQSIFEKNLPTIMGLEVIASELSIKNRRIDTLAFDHQTMAFVILEYKRDKSISVVDQGFAYLSLMLENRADFIITYNENLNRNLLRKDVDWSQTRVAFVSPSFNENQKLATNFKDISIELWEIKRFENGVISINEIKKSSSAESIKPLAKENQEIKSVTSEIIVYNEDSHLIKVPEEIKELYERYKSAILLLADDIEIKANKLYIAFKKGQNIVSIELQKGSLKLFLNLKKGELSDPKKLARDVSSIGHRGTGHYQVQVKDDENLEYIMSLVKQGIQKLAK